MMKITKTIPLILVLLVLLVGCGQSDEVSIAETFIGGSEGLELNLQSGSPPTEVFDGGNTIFDINVKIENMGETEVKAEDVQVKLVGLYAPDFGKTETEFILNAQEAITPKVKTLEGSVLDGGATNVIFTNLNYAELLSGDQLFEPRLDICYKYDTKAVSKICVLQDLLRESETSYCRVSEAKDVQNSAAPVAVTKVTESRSGTDKIALTLEVSNVGTGKVYKQTTQCSKDFRDKNKVYVTVDTGVETPATCTGLRDEIGNAVQSNVGYVILGDDGKATITCTQEVTTQTDFEKIINLKLDYDYEQEQPFQVLVKHLG